MQSRTLLAMFLAAVPSAALAFDDMDCIGTEICNDEGCAPSFLAYTLDFDWPADAVIAAFAGNTLSMALVAPEGEVDAVATHHVANGPGDTGLWLTLDGDTLAMELFNGSPGTTHHAVCAERESA